MKLKTPELFFSPRVLILKDEATKTEQYEVYYVFNTETKDLLYIGSGKKGRHKHVFSGASQNVSLNVCMICSVPMTITVKGIASKEESLAIELEEIKKLNPRFNGRFTSTLDLSEIDIEDLDRTMEALLSKEAPTLKAICELYNESPNTCKQKYSDWYKIIETLGVEVCKAKAYRKKDIKALYEKAIADNSAPIEVKIAKAFKIGGVYTMKQIKDLLVKCRAPKTSGAALKLWFEVQETKTNGKMAYRVIRKL